MSRPAWTEEQITALQARWSAPDVPSAAVIGHEIGKTKGAVISKAYRLGLPKRERPIVRKRPSPIVVPHTSPTPTWIRREGCQWIYGDGPFKEAEKCGQAVFPGSSYCAHHAARCYIARPRDKEVA